MPALLYLPYTDVHRREGRLAARHQLSSVTGGESTTRNPLHITTTELPGGKIETVDQELTVGDSVRIAHLGMPTAEQRSAVDILGEAPGQRLFKTAEEVRSYRRDGKTS